MEVNGRVIAVLEPQTFKGRNGSDFTKNGFVIETSGQFSKRLKFDVLNTEMWNKILVREGADVSVSFDAESREWNGRWYTTLMCWRCVVVNGATPIPIGGSIADGNVGGQSVSQPQSVSNNSSNDEIPF